MNCTAFEQTSAYIDGELDDAASALAARHIDGCPACQSLIEAASAASEAFGRSRTEIVAPLALQTRVRARLADQASAQARGRQAPRPLRTYGLGVLSGVGASALAASLLYVVTLPPAADRLTAALADDHVAALEQGRAIDVVSSSHHTVKPWFAGRAAVSPPVADFAAQGFSLAGGRVSRAAGPRTAVVAYRHGAHEIDLYVWRRGRVSLASAADRRGFHVVSWIEGDLALAAVSDVSAPELQRFTDLVKAARE